MYVKTHAGAVVRYPYGVDDLRRDNAGTSFPDVISDQMLADYGVFRVTELPRPQSNAMTQDCIHDAEPRLQDGAWVIGCRIEDKPVEEAARNVRSQRDKFLSECDWVIIMHTEKGTNIPAPWEIYRQSLRDITAQSGFPHNVQWPAKPE